MFFLRLGIINAVRNLQRSTYAIVAVAMAAAFMTYAISLSRGYATGFNAEYRAQIGGDIVMYQRPFISNLTATEESWIHERPAHDMLTSIEEFFPEILKSGYMAIKDRETPAFSESYLEGLLADHNISGFYPRYQIPVFYTGKPDAERLRYLRGRDFDLDQRLYIHPRNYLMQGRWFAQGQDDLVAVVHYDQMTVDYDREYLGKILTLEVPRIDKEGEEYRFNFYDPIQIELTVIGVMHISTRRIPLDPPPSQRWLDMSWNLGEIQIPLATWKRIWEMAAGDTEYIPEEVSIMVEDTIYLEDTVLEIRSTFPGHTVISVPTLIEKALAQNLLDDLPSFLQKQQDSLKVYLETQGDVEPDPLLMDQLSTYETLHSAYVQNETDIPMGMPNDLRLPTVVLVFLNAALVLAANLYILVSSRVVEIGTLKSVGSTRKEILVMVCTEASLIGLLGACGGFLFMRLPVIFNQIIGGSLPIEILSRFLGDALLVLSATFLTVLLFALLPASRMANLPAMRSFSGQ